MAIPKEIKEKLNEKIINDLEIELKGLPEAKVKQILDIFKKMDDLSRAMREDEREIERIKRISEETIAPLRKRIEKGGEDLHLLSQEQMRERQKLARDLRQISANSVKAFNDPNSLSAQ